LARKLEVGFDHRDEVFAVVPFAIPQEALGLHGIDVQDLPGLHGFSVLS